jgi:SAM-dependent methyltransferase
MTEPDRTFVRRLAAESNARGDATGWFDVLYRHADGDLAAIPWADRTANAQLVEWLEAKPLAELGLRALVVGCGLGDDAEYLAALGLEVTAFDISPEAVAWSQRRFPGSRVRYRAADLLNPPAEFTAAFDFIFEAYTLQSLPVEVRRKAMPRLAGFLAPGGTLLVIARGRDDAEPLDQMPWPLSREELAPLAASGLEIISFEDYFDREASPVRRFRATYRRQS